MVTSDTDYHLMEESRTSAVIVGDSQSTIDVFGAVRFGKFFVLGCGSWLMVTALFGDLPVIYSQMPEGKALYADVDLAVQLANVCPIALVLFLPEFTRRHNRGFVSALFVIAVSSAVLLAVAWDSTVVTRSGERSSWALLVASFGAGVVGSTSMVTFFPFAAEYGPTAITCLSAGVGACGLITQLLAAAQGVAEAGKHTANNATATGVEDDADGSLRFSVGVYFAIVTGLVLVAAGGFVAILVDDKLEQLQPRHHLLESDSEEDAWEVMKSSRGAETTPQCCAKLLDDASEVASEHRRLLLNTAFTCLLQFSIPGMLSFLCDQTVDDGTKKTQLFWLTFVFFVGSLVGRFGPGISRVLPMEAANALQLLLWLYALWVSNLGHLEKTDPNGRFVPPMWLSTCLMFGFSVLHGYTVTVAFVEAGKASQLASQWTGMVNQVGALCGALFTFILVHTGVMK